METLFTNKRFIQVCTVLAVLLSVATVFSMFKGLKSHKKTDNGQNVITVTASADVTAIPDIANISFTLSKDASTSKEAQSSLNEMVSKVLAYTKSQKIADKDIKSEYGGVAPKYSNSQIYCIKYPCPQGDVKITGYTAIQTITIKVRDVDSANQIRTGLADLGVKDISGPTFSIDDEEVLQTQARDKAIIKAKEKAKDLAKALGVHLGSVTSFSENSGGYPVMYAKGMDMAVSSSMAPQVAPELPKGETKVTSTVTVTYEIK